MVQVIFWCDDKYIRHDNSRYRHCQPVKKPKRDAKCCKGQKGSAKIDQCLIRLHPVKAVIARPETAHALLCTKDKVGDIPHQQNTNDYAKNGKGCPILYDKKPVFNVFTFMLKR